MENDVITPKYTIFDLGYERNLTKTDSFYDSDPTNADKVTASLPSILISGGGLAGNITMVDGFLQSSNYVAGSTGWKLTNDTAYLPAIDLSGYLLATGGAYKTAATGSRVEIFPDANTGIIAYDDAGNTVFTVLVGGTNQGDVVIGDFANSKGVMWDKSAGTFIVKGSIVTEAGSEISGEYIDALNVGKLTSGEIVSKILTLSFTPGGGNCAIRCGKTDFTNDEVGFIIGFDDNDDKVKMLFGNTTEYFNIIGDTFVNTLRVGGYTASVGGTTLLSSTTSRNTTNTTYTKVKEIVVGRRGDYKINVDYKTYMSAPQHGYFSLRKVIGGSETEIRSVRILGGTPDLNVTDTVTGMSAGDGFRLYAKVEAGSDGPAGGYMFDLKVDVNDEIYSPYYTSGYN